jgi:hypothetical protein
MDESLRYEWLRKLGELHDDRQRGKILQRLLELAFDRLGFRLAEERLSEGIDFDVQRRGRPNEKYSLEARTTEDAKVVVKAEDLRQMEERAREGYQAGIAAMRIAPGSRWVLVKRAELMTPSLRISVGDSPGWEELARQINEEFNEVLEKLGPVALEQGLQGLQTHIEAAKRH